MLLAPTLGLDLRASLPHLQTPSFPFPFPLLPPSFPIPSNQPNPTQLTTTPHTGVKSYEVSLESQTATVVAEPTLSYETVLTTIKKTGKKVNTGEADGETRPVEIVSEA